MEYYSTVIGEKHRVDMQNALYQGHLVFIDGTLRKSLSKSSFTRSNRVFMNAI